MADLSPQDVAEWLASMASCIPFQVLTELKARVVAGRIHGAQFAAILSECRLKDLGVEHLSPLHLTRLRKVWNADFPDSGGAAPPSPTAEQGHALPLARGSSQQQHQQGGGGWHAAGRNPSPQPAAPMAGSGMRPHSVESGTPQTVPVPMVAVALGRLARWAGFDLLAAISELRSILDPRVCDELAIVLAGAGPPTDFKPPPRRLAPHEAMPPERVAEPPFRGGGMPNGGGGGGGCMFPEHDPYRRASPGPSMQAEHDGYRRMPGEGMQRNHMMDHMPNGDGGGPRYAGREPAPALDGPHLANPRQMHANMDRSPMNGRAGGAACGACGGIDGIGGRGEPRSPPLSPRPLGRSPGMGCSAMAGLGGGCGGGGGWEGGCGGGCMEGSGGGCGGCPSHGVEAGMPRSSPSRNEPQADRPGSSQSPGAAAGSGGGAGGGPSTMSAEAVAAWIRALPPSQVPNGPREALAVAVENEDLDGDSFGQVIGDAQALAVRNVPSPVHHLRLRRAWEQVLREEQCRAVAREVARAGPAEAGRGAAASAPPKAVKMII